MRRPARWTALVALLLVGTAVGGPAAARPGTAVVPADTGDELLLSVDGRTWAPDVTTPLIDPDLVWVPGDVATGRLYARNASVDEASAVATVVLGTGEGTALASQLHVRTRLGAGPWTDGLRSGATDLAPGEVVPIGLEVAFDPAATNASQRQRVEVDVVVTLSGAGQDEPGPGDAGADGPGVLPRTGANLLLPTLVAAGAVVLGVLLRRRARRG
ncbi:hypothetical protein [Promicromonospora sp. NPDC019610]|uniref:hypothetical protein n=1 Tax=Promicromonospora sp. NPDC019610 TaxID=3364405 RepID=UPI0037963DFA